MSKYRELDEVGRIKLSRSFFMRDFLFSEIAAAYSILNVPDDLELAIYTGRELCERLLEPLQEAFGRVHVRSGYRSARLNEFGNKRSLNCSSNERSYADHIWDRRDAHGNAGACACIVVPSFLERHEPEEWEKLAWWLWDHLDFHKVVFFGRQAAFNLGWRENPAKEVLSHTAPRGRLTAPWMLNSWGTHEHLYPGLPPSPRRTEPSARAGALGPRDCNPLHDVGQQQSGPRSREHALWPGQPFAGAQADHIKEGLRVQR